ncbi:BrnT family toxin [Pasteurellaceae bacterium TAE3-ERU1]|nr:BrnT family toxin [Pasteurellaceae bacterium TAE3-ERU1]
MMCINFEWDENKAAINERKHGVTFCEAMTVFDDEKALFMLDPEHSHGEERFLLLGMSNIQNVLVVVHCERRETIRIISARKATKREAQHYRGQS